MQFPRKNKKYRKLKNYTSYGHDCRGMAVFIFALLLLKDDNNQRGVKQIHLTLPRVTFPLFHKSVR